MARIYFQLRELREDGDGEHDRRIFTFETEDDANAAYEFFVKLGVSPRDLYIREIEAK